jgi:hypothetical protein
MSDPTPLEIAAALRSTAEWIRDPQSPRYNGGAYCVDDDENNYHDPNAPEATKWCAVGYFAKIINAADIPAAERLIPKEELRQIWRAFDLRHFELSASGMEAVASALEASIPTQQTAEQREPSHV